MICDHCQRRTGALIELKEDKVCPTCGNHSELIQESYPKQERACDKLAKLVHANMRASGVLLVVVGGLEGTGLSFAGDPAAVEPALELLATTIPGLRKSAGQHAATVG